MKNCPFCLENKILKGEILKENDLCYFVETIDKITSGGMIITKRHITPFEINNDEWLAIKEILDETKSILSKKNPDGYNIGWNIGSTAGQRVDHAHLHIMARFNDEPLSGKGIQYFFKQENNRRKKIST